MFTLSVFRIDNRINFTGVSLEMSRSHSSLQLHLECCLYERATGVKPEFLTSNHSDSDQSKIEDGDVLKTESLITFWHDKSPIAKRVLRQIFINWQQLLNLGREQSIWITRRTHNWRDLKLSDDTQLISRSLIVTENTNTR